MMMMITAGIPSGSIILQFIIGNRCCFPTLTVMLVELPFTSHPWSNQQVNQKGKKRGIENEWTNQQNQTERCKQTYSNESSAQLKLNEAKKRNGDHRNHKCKTNSDGKRGSEGNGGKMKQMQHPKEEWRRVGARAKDKVALDGIWIY